MNSLSLLHYPGYSKNYENIFMGFLLYLGVHSFSQTILSQIQTQSMLQIQKTTMLLYTLLLLSSFLSPPYILETREYLKQHILAHSFFTIILVSPKTLSHLQKTFICDASRPRRNRRTRCDRQEGVTVIQDHPECSRAHGEASARLSPRGART